MPLGCTPAVVRHHEDVSSNEIRHCKPDHGSEPGLALACKIEHGSQQRGCRGDEYQGPQKPVSVGVKAQPSGHGRLKTLCLHLPLQAVKRCVQPVEYRHTAILAGIACGPVCRLGALPKGRRGRPVYPRPMNPMPQPGEPCPGFIASPAGAGRWSTATSSRRQHCAEPPSRTERWFSARGDSRS